MITTDHDILQVLLDSISVDKKERIFSSNHILNDILDLPLFKKNKEEKINFLILFNLCEELLNNCRKNNYNLSLFYKNRLCNIYKSEIENKLKSVFSIVYYPCIAYFEYQYGDIYYAIKYLDNCIDYIKLNDELNDNEQFKSAICEQMLNRYKCLIKAQAYQEALSCSKELLSYIDRNFSHNEMYKSKYIYYLEELFSKITNSTINTHEFIKNIQNELIYFINSQFFIMDNLFDSNLEYTSTIKSQLDAIVKLPNILKLLIVRFYSEINIIR